MLLTVGNDQIFHADAAIVKLTGNGLLLAFIHHVTVHVSDRRQTDQNTRAVIIAQATLHAVLTIQRRVDVIGLANLVRVLLQPLVFNH